jgi:RNA polymerase sigma factor for flagellar operon FliA
VTMRKYSAAVAAVHVRALATGAASAVAVREAPTRMRIAPAKPMAVSGTLHSPARGSDGGQLHRPASGPVPVKTNPTQQQAARLARRDRVVLEHLPLVKAIAVRVHENLPVHVDLDDLVHAGILGLFDAANKFNPEKQVVFSSYAKHRVKGAMLDSLRQLDWASRDMRRRHKQVEAATRDLASTLQRTPTEAEIAEKLGMDVDRWRTMMLDLRNVGLISASTRPNENDDLPAPDFPSKPETQPDSICAREQLRSMLGEAMKTLPERYQKVVLLYYTNEMTMKEIGGVLGINESRVSQIHKSALEKMAVALEASGIKSSQAF